MCIFSLFLEPQALNNFPSVLLWVAIFVPPTVSHSTILVISKIKSLSLKGVLLPQGSVRIGLQPERTKTQYISRLMFQS